MGWGFRRRFFICGQDMVEWCALYHTGSLVGILLFGLELFVCGRRMLFSSEEELGTP